MKTCENKIIDFFEKNFIFFESYPKNKKWKIEQNWRKNFSLNLKKQTGKWIVDGYDWHIFSRKFKKCYKGEIAINKFIKLDDQKLFIGIYNSNNIDIIYSCQSKKLNFLLNLNEFLLKEGLLCDIYLYSIDFSWTMVYTHENNFGPYFSFSSD